MRHDEVSLDNCLKCSVCNTVCPVAAVVPAFPGPKHLGPELERLRREGLPCDSHWVEDCTGCARCDSACPNQVVVSELIAAAKARHAKPPARRLRDAVLARPELLGRLFGPVPGLVNGMLRLGPARRVMDMTLKISADRPFPSYARPYRPEPAGAESTGVDASGAVQPGGGRPVVVYPGCSIRYNEPRLGEAVEVVLRRNGYVPIVAGAGCCGLPAMANGATDEARRRARALIAELSAAAAEGTPIVTACTSCSHMLKSGYRTLLGDDPALARAARDLASTVYDLGEFLAVGTDGPDTETVSRDRELRVAYHAPCHQQTQGIGRPWYHLLRGLPGVRVTDLDAGCCGMAGTFGFKAEKATISMAIGQRLFDAVTAARPDVVVSECPTCRLQIEHGAGLPVAHPVMVLLAADRRGMGLARMGLNRGAP